MLWPNGDPHTSFFVDGAPLIIDYLPTDAPMVETLKLANGTHSLQIASSADSPRSDPMLINVANPPSPTFPGQLVELGPDVTGLPGPFPEPMAQMELGGSIAADIDGDGKLDVFTWRAWDSGQLYLQDTPLHFHPVGPTFSGVLAAAAGDLDNDGRTDLVIVGSSIRLLHNTGAAPYFEDLTLAAGVPEEVAPQDPGLAKSYQGVTLADIDDDGLLDVAIARMDCNGGANVVLRNEGDFHFARIDEQLGLTFPDRATFDLLMDRLEPGGPLVVWTYFEGCRPEQIGLYVYPPGDDLPGKPTTTITQTMRGSMGSAYFDVNGDGVLDLWSSGTEINPVLLGPDYVEDVGPSAGLQSFPDPMGHLPEQWDEVFFDADMDGKADLFFVQTPATPDTADRMQPRDRFAWQAGPGEWREASHEIGLTDDRHSCEVAQGADLDGDGDADLLVGCYGYVRLLRNDVAQNQLGRTVVLHGTLSNPNGVSALLTGPSGEQRLVRGGGQPFAGGVVSESLRADGPVRVRWPSGLVQQVEPGTAPVLTMTEPELFHLGARRVSAGTPVAVPVEISPAEIGQPEAAVQVSLSAGSWAQPLVKGMDGVWRGKILTPAEVSVVVLTLTVGAQTIAVRPRIYVR